MHGTWEDVEERRPRVGECEKWELGLPSAKTPPTSSAPPTYPLLMVSNLGQEGLVTGAAGGQNRGVVLGRKQGGHFPAGRTFAPQPKQADLARCLLLLTLEKIQN